MPFITLGELVIDRISLLLLQINKSVVMKKILILNGPNLNFLGIREPGIYGSDTMDDCLSKLQEHFQGVTLEAFQSNSEGGLIDRLQATIADGTEGVVFNAGAYTHTSLALADCIRSLRVPVVEVHISNVYAREEIRHRSLIAPACKGVISGFGLGSYRLAVEALLMEA